MLLATSRRRQTDHVIESKQAAMLLMTNSPCYWEQADHVIDDKQPILLGASRPCYRRQADNAIESKSTMLLQEIQK
jgi:hypothetical protein